MMKQISNRLATWLGRPLRRPLERLQERFRRARPGSVLILVVALLVLLALMGTAYMASARLERQQAAASGGQRMLLEAVETYAKQYLDKIQAAIAADSGNLVTCPSDGSVATTFLANRSAGLLPELTGPGQSTLFPNTPVWPVISRDATQQFESPYNPTANNNNPNPPLFTYGVSPGANGYAAPTNLAIQYTNPDADPSLAGQTRVYPAFRVIVPNIANNDPTHYAPIPGGPYLAGDATGMGVADCALVRLTASPVQGVDFYAGARVIDNGAAFNLNTAWSPTMDLDPNKNCYNFFPTDLDLLGMMNSTYNSSNYNYQTPTAAPEMAAIDLRRFVQGLGWNSVLDDKGTAHNDLQKFNDAEVAWMHYGRRPSYPTFGSRFGDLNAGVYSRAFADADTTVGLAWRGGLVNMDSPLCKIDDQMQKMSAGAAPNAPPIFQDSIFMGAANCVSNAGNRFRSFAANNVGYWYDWYWNVENVSGAGPVQFPIATASISASLGMGTAVYNSGQMPFRPTRGLVVGANPVANLCRMIDPATLPQSVVAAAASPAQIIPPVDLAHPHKAGLNTSDFPELWRAFINVMGATGLINTQTGLAAFRVPGNAPDDHSGNALNGSICRNVIREPSSGSTRSTNLVSPIDTAVLRMNQENVLALRAALAAVNVLTLRSSQGTTAGTNYFIPNPVRAAISLQLSGGNNAGPVQVLVYGVTAHPFITEVYCNNDATKHSEDSDHVNAKGIVVLKLYNPYPFDINLNDYQFAVVNRKPGGTYPNMPLKLLAPLKLGNSAVIGANSIRLVSNYDPASTGVAESTHWPPATGLAAPPNDLITAPDLWKVIDDGGAGVGAEPGGELVLLRTLIGGNQNNQNIKPEVPVDSYDFTGFTQANTPLGGKQTEAHGWHYVRTSGLGQTKQERQNRWKWVFAGEYNAQLGNNGSFAPRLTATEVEDKWDPNAGSDAEPWVSSPNASMKFDSAIATGTNARASGATDFNGIELCNVDMGGFNKAPVNGNKHMYPFGAFARVGDVVHAPFIGSYVILKTPDPNATGQTPTNIATALTEINPVTMDTCVADDGDQSDDANEQVGRFVPVRGGQNVDDYFLYGYYGVNQSPNPDPNPLPKLPAHGGTSTFELANNTRFAWRYRFAVGVLDQFTVVSNPENDYYPNVHPFSWGGSVPPFPVSQLQINAPANNNQGTANNASGGAPELATEGLININSASWRVLAAMEMIPRAQDSSGALNAQLAQLIVRYRDVDDGIARKVQDPNNANNLVNGPPQGHGPFRSLMELNQVFDPTAPANKPRTFQNALGLLPQQADTTDPTLYDWGNYAPGPVNFNNNGKLKDPQLDNKPYTNFLPATLMVSRISNLVTTRSDSFTVYVVVQGWRNANSQHPELVLQKRLAMVVDRSALGVNAGSQQGIQTYNIPAD
jgi:hypothetical protein